jgi:hypothetical protein
MAAMGTDCIASCKSLQCHTECSATFSVIMPIAGKVPSNPARFSCNPASTYSIPAFTSTSSKLTPAAQNAHIIHELGILFPLVVLAMSASLPNFRDHGQTKTLLNPPHS